MLIAARTATAVFCAAAEAAEILHGLGFSSSEFERPFASFSGGWRIRLSLAQALMRPADLLLLDEPTNHLDAESVAWLEHHLAEYKGTVIAITHDRYFLDNVAGWILELDRGEGIPYKGNYTSWLEQKTARLAQEEKSESKRQRVLKQELEWVRSNPSARRTTSSVASKSASVSPGNPTMMSVVIAACGIAARTRSMMPRNRSAR